MDCVIQAHAHAWPPLCRVLHRSGYIWSGTQRAVAYPKRAFFLEGLEPSNPLSTQQLDVSVSVTEPQLTVLFRIEQMFST